MAVYFSKLKETALKIRKQGSEIFRVAHKLKKEMKTMKPIDIAKIVVLMILLKKRKFRLAGIFSIFLAIQKIKSLLKIEHDDLLELGAESRVISKYFNSSIVTFKSGNAITALSISTISSGAYAKQPKHIVFVSYTGQSGMFVPAMAGILDISEKCDSNVIVHSYHLHDEVTESEFTKWILDDLRATPSEPVTLIAHSADSCAHLTGFIRKAIELSRAVKLIFVNPLTFTGNSLIDFLPMKNSFLSFYAGKITKFVDVSRTLHGKEVPILDSTMVEYGLLSNRTSSFCFWDTQTRLPAAVNFICGDQDWNCGPVTYEEMNLKLGGNDQVVFLRGLGGHPHLEDPKKFSEAVLLIS